MSCWKCWASDARGIDIAKDGAVVAIGELCDRCFDKALAGADEMRVEFEALLAAGVSREEANAHMIRKINGGRNAT